MELHTIGLYKLRISYQGIYQAWKVDPGDPRFILKAINVIWSTGNGYLFGRRRILLLSCLSIVILVLFPFCCSTVSSLLLLFLGWHYFFCHFLLALFYAIFELVFEDVFPFFVCCLRCSCCVKSNAVQSYDWAVQTGKPSTQSTPPYPCILPSATAQIEPRNLHLWHGLRHSRHLWRIGTALRRVALKVGAAEGSGAGENLRVWFGYGHLQD